MAKNWRGVLVTIALLAASSSVLAASVWSTNGYKKVTEVTWDGEKKRTLFQLENGNYFQQGKANSTTWCQDKGYFEVKDADGSKEALALLTSVMLSGRTVKFMVRQDGCGEYGASLASLLAAK